MLQLAQETKIICHQERETEKTNPSQTSVIRKAQENHWQVQRNLRIKVRVTKVKSPFGEDSLHKIGKLIRQNKGKVSLVRVQ